MFRYLATLAVACLALVGFASHVSAQAPSVGSVIFEAVRPFIVEAIGALIASMIVWLAATLKAKLNIDIDARHREALQEALTNAAGLVINRAGGAAGALVMPSANPAVQAGVSYVIAAVPDALKHFGITPAAARNVLTEKLEAKIGVLTAPGAAAKA